VRDALWVQLIPYRERHPTARWLEPATWHLTLLFLGSVRVERIAELVGMVDLFARDEAPFQVSIDGGGGRVRRQEAVAWLTIGDGTGEVIGMADRLLEASPADVTSGAPPKRAPSAHLTVARRADRDLVADLTGQRHGRLAASWSAGQLLLMRSHLGPNGARYETLHEATLYAATE